MSGWKSGDDHNGKKTFLAIQLLLYFNLQIGQGSFETNNSKVKADILDQILPTSQDVWVVFRLDCDLGLSANVQDSKEGVG